MGEMMTFKEGMTDMAKRESTTKNMVEMTDMVETTDLEKIDDARIVCRTDLEMIPNETTTTEARSRGMKNETHALEDRENEKAAMGMTPALRKLTRKSRLSSCLRKKPERTNQKEPIVTCS